MKKEILIITNYFPPESGAASNRMFSVVKGFSKNGYRVSVVCPFPNYPNGKIFENFSGKLYHTKEEPYGSLIRLWIWPTKSSNKFIRLFSMLSFSFSLKLFMLLKKTPENIFIQYSPLFVGFTGVFLSSFFRKKVILNVSDLWPLAGLEMGLLNKGGYYKILCKMESFCYRNSDYILGQSEEIITHVKKIASNTSLFLYRNYPEFNPPLAINNNLEPKKIRIVYAGLLGIAQGLYKICNEISFSENVSLHIYGAGPEAELINNLNKPNIYYYGEMAREKLHDELQNYDIGFVPLTNRIYGSVPSKIFELSRLGIPLLYFAGGEGETIVKNNSLGFTIPVKNIIKLQGFIDTITIERLSEFSKSEVQKKAVTQFDFDNQFGQLIKKLNAN